MASVRKEMIEGEIRRALSEIITYEVRDPAVPEMTNIISVEAAADLSVAKVRVSILGDDEALKNAVAALNRASGFVRHELGSRVDLRHTPKLVFIADRSISHSIEIQKVLERIHEQEQR